MLPSPSDTRASLIVRLCDQEDRDAWDEVMTIYGPLVFRNALRKGLQRADAEDVVQQVFSAIFQSVEKWLEQSERGRFRNWLIGIGRNVALNMLNRKPKSGIGVGGTEGHDKLDRLKAAEDEFASELFPHPLRSLEMRRTVFVGEISKSDNIPTEKIHAEAIKLPTGQAGGGASPLGL